MDKTRYFIDTEFAESPGQLDLISIGIACEDGRTYYAEMEDGWNPARCNEWVRANVLPSLTGPVKRRDVVRDQVFDFVVAGEHAPEFWGYYADYDWVAFCWLFGAMIDLPAGWPMFCRDLKQVAEERGVKLPHSNDDHHALADAQDMLRNWKWLNEAAEAAN